MLKNVAQQRQLTTNVRAGQSRYRGRDQGLRGRRDRPYKSRVISRPVSGEVSDGRETAFQVSDIDEHWSDVQGWLNAASLSEARPTSTGWLGTRKGVAGVAYPFSA